jgi:nuclear pore complex protein Nup205
MIENLHAYWVYEAKIAFLVAIASTRKGAEDLLDAGLFERFSTCSFINVQPISDTSMGRSSSFVTDSR